MGREKSLPQKRLLRLGLIALALVGCAASGLASAQNMARSGGWLRAISGVNERPVREPLPLAPEAQHRHGDAEDGRNPRRWSPEERRQLRDDIHQAGRDVYGGSPRRRD